MIHVRHAAVQIYDTDASGLIFYGAPMRWFAEGEQGLNNQGGLHELLGYDEEFDKTGPQAPTRAVELSLEAPLHLWDRFEHRTWISRVGTTSYTVSHLVLVDELCRVRGTVHRVMVAPDADGSLVPVPVPSELRRYVSDGQLAHD